jgi:uncharacterized membrane protein
MEGENVSQTPQEPISASVAPEAKIVFSEKDITDNKYIAALSYIGILFLIPLLAKKDSPFAQFHAKQGLVLCVVSILFSFIPFFGWLVNLGLFVVVVIALIKTLSGEAWEIPFVKDAVKKINL